MFECKRWTMDNSLMDVLKDGLIVHFLLDYINLKNTITSKYTLNNINCASYLWNLSRAIADHKGSDLLAMSAIKKGLTYKQIIRNMKDCSICSSSSSSH